MIVTIMLMSLGLASEMMKVPPASDVKLGADLPGACANLHTVYDFDSHLETLVLKDLADYADEHLPSETSCAGVIKSDMGDVMMWYVIGDEWMYNEGTIGCTIEDDGSMICAMGEDDYVEEEYTEEVTEDIPMEESAPLEEEDHDYVFESKTLQAVADGTYSLDHWDEEYELSVAELQWIHNDYAETLTELALADWPEGSPEQTELLQYASQVAAEAEAMTEQTRRRLRRSKRAGKRKACPKKDALCVGKFEKAVNKLLGHARSEQQAEGEKWCKKPSNKRYRRGIRCCPGKTGCGPVCGKGGCWPWQISGVPDCCGDTQIDFYCYKDSEVCPPKMVSCSPWGRGEYCDLYKSGECTKKTFEGWVMVLDIVANVAAMMFTGGASTAAKAAIKTGAKAVAKATGKAALRAAAKAAWRVGKQVAKNMKQNLAKHFRRVGRQLKKELKEMIQDEAMTIYMGDLAKKEGGISASELLEMIDPTGVAALANFINSAEKCIYPPHMSEHEMGQLEDAAAIAPVGKDINNYNKNAGKGGWGGTCTCPNGETYLVGDNYDSCGSLACVGGTSGECIRESGGWSGASVICNTKPDDFREDAGSGGWGGYCTCPNGAIYPIGDSHDYCKTLACYGGIHATCSRKTGEWSGNKVWCSTTAEETAVEVSQAEATMVMEIVGEPEGNTIVYGFAAIGVGAMFYFAASKMFGKEEYKNIEEETEE